MSETERFHSAARDGHVQLLRRTSRRDCNRRDEDGRTPTYCAAHSGNLDALRLLVARGGDPDRCDDDGWTCLHAAAAAGSMRCVSFLVSFGANVWSLDNELHSPLELASLHEHADIVQFLDEECTSQSVANPRSTRRLRERAHEQAVRRATKCAQRREKALRKAAAARKASKSARPTSAPLSNQPLPFSAHLSTSYGKRSLGGVAKKLRSRQQRGSFPVCTEEDGRRTIRAPSGLQNDIVYVRTEETERSDSGVESSDNSSQPDAPSLFERPGFGSVAFIKTRLNTAGHANGYAFVAEVDETDVDVLASNVQKLRWPGGPLPSSLTSHLSRHTNVLNMNWAPGNKLQRHLSDATDSSSSPMSSSSSSEASTLSSSVQKAGKAPAPGASAASPLEDDDDNDFALLDAFLTEHGLADWTHVFRREHVDLESLLLLTDSDLVALGLPLGPRRKLLTAVERRQRQENVSSDVMDLRL